MENREHVKPHGVKRILGAALAVTVGVGFPHFIAGYKVVTHAALTDAVVDFYNRRFPQQVVGDELRTALRQGAQAEDTNPRWLYHFYDFQYRRGLTMGAVTWESAKQWAQDDLLQAKLAPNYQLASLVAFTDEPITFTWDRALAAYRSGDRTQAFLILGHILHLIEDMAVPEHTRNDPHPFFNPYEEFARRLKPPILAEESPVLLPNLDAYFDALTAYTGRYFYSTNTVDHSAYPDPRPTSFRRSGNFDYGYAADDRGQDYALVRRSGRSLILDTPLLTIDDQKILTGYWQLLAPQAISYGAGVLHLFLSQVVVSPALTSGVVTSSTDVSAPSSLVGQAVAAVQRLLSPAKTSFEDHTVVTLTLPTTRAVPSAFPSPPPAAAVSPAASSSQGCSWETGYVPTYQPLIINEINWAGAAGNPADEWIELKNVSDGTVNLTGWQLVSESGNITHRFADDAVVPARRFLMVRRGLDYRGALRNSGDGLRLFAGQCRLIDQALAYPQWPAGDNVDKRSAERSADLSWHTGNPSSPGGENSTKAAPTEGGGRESGSGSTPAAPQPEERQQNLSPSPSEETTHSSGLAFISEVLFDAEGADDGREFIELYNPTDQTVNLSSWFIHYQSSSGALSKKHFEKDNRIGPGQFFLVWLGNDDRADMSWRSGSFHNSGATISLINGSTTVDSITYGGGSIMPQPGQSLERRALQNGACVSTQDSGEFLGNGCDTDGFSDWEVRTVPHPQNTKSLPEPRSAPAAAVAFSVSFSSTTMELVFQWEPSVTEDVHYLLAGDVPVPLVATSTAARLGIKEVNRVYSFSLQTIDRDGLGSVTTTASVTPPGFLQEFFFYHDARPASSTTAMVEFSVEKYPFIPDVFHQGAMWKTMVFYLNRDPEPIAVLDDPFRFSALGDTTTVSYETCSYPGHETPQRFMVFPDTPERCGVSGGAYNRSLLFSRLEDKRFFIPLAVPGESALTENDYVTVAYYATAALNPSDGNYPYFRLVAVDKQRQYFQAAPPPHRPPLLDGPLTVNFDGENSHLAIEWPAATDPDTMDAFLNYDMRYRSSEEWQTVRGRRTVRTVAPDDSFQIAVRARDEFNNYSETLVQPWSYPRDEGMGGEGDSG